MGKSNRKTPFVFYFGLVLLTLVMFSTHFMSGLYARYTTMANGGDGARVASFEVSEVVKFGEKEIVIGTYDIAETFGIDADGKFTDKTFTFTVANKSEVAVKYTVKAESTGNLPLEFELIENNTKKDEISLATGADSTFTFRIKWKAEDLDAKYIGMVDYITITVTAEQID